MNSRSVVNLLQENPLGLVLSAVCGFFLFVLLVMMIISALPLSSRVSESKTSGAGGNTELPTLAEKKPIDTYYVINERPLFNESRRPIIEPVEEVDPLGEEIEEEVVETPEVELMGVVITPSLRMVTLKKKDDEESLVAFEGQPIEGEFGGWQVTEIGPRMATLTSGNGEELLLELQVHDERIEAPKQTPDKAPAPDQKQKSRSTQAAAENSEPMSRAEEIRQRIAERREELRRESELAGQAGQGEEEAAPPPNYESAIQNMIERRGKERTQNQDEQ